MLPTGRRLVYLFDSHERWESDLPTSYGFTVQVVGPHGPVEPCEYAVDFATWAESLMELRPTKRLEDDLKAVSETTKDFSPAPAADRLARRRRRPGPRGPRLRLAVIRRRRPRPGHADPRDGVLLVVGDFDCSGEDIERDWVARTGCWSHAERVLLIYEQVRAYELPATEGKHGDPRWPGFARR